MSDRGISTKAPSRLENPYLERFRKSSLGSYFTPTQLEAVGIGYEGLRALLDGGYVVREGRGLYHFAEAEITEHTSLAAVCARVPRSIICLITALQVHDIGTQLSHAVWLAIPKSAKPPKVESVALRLVKFSESAWNYGVVETSFEGVPARITNPARTVLDCFRFERLIGREAAMEALRDGLGRKTVAVDALYRAMEVLPSRGLSAALEHMT
jgi:predicted transcriptional regulator of viral defense system